jgi:uncharacterized protein (DUF983 family)
VYDVVLAALTLAQFVLVGRMKKLRECERRRLMSDSSSSSGGAGFTSLLLVAFIVLKLTHVIAWSWWWVLSPLWVSTAIVLLVLGIMIAIALCKPKRSNGHL